MSTPGQEPEGPQRGHYGEIAPGVPRYGQYAPEGYQPPAGMAPFSGGPTNSQPPLQGVPGDPVVMPRQVRLACRLILLAAVINAVLTVVGCIALLTPAGRSAAIDVMTQAGLSDTSLIDPIITATWIIGIISTVLYIIILIALRRGKNWARIASVVLAIISLLALVSPNLVTIVQVILGVVAAVLVFREPGASYFRKPRS